MFENGKIITFSNIIYLEEIVWMSAFTNSLVKVNGMTRVIAT